MALVYTGYWAGDSEKAVANPELTLTRFTIDLSGKLRREDIDGVIIHFYLSAT